MKKKVSFTALTCSIISLLVVLDGYAEICKLSKVDTFCRRTKGCRSSLLRGPRLAFEGGHRFVTKLSKERVICKRMTRIQGSG